MFDFKRPWEHKGMLLLLLVQLVSGISLLFFLESLHILATGRYLLVIGVLLLLFVGVYLLQTSKRHKVLPIVGQVTSVIVILISVFVTYNVIKTDQALDKVTQGNEETSIMSIVVLKESQIESVESIKDDYFGVLGKADSENSNKVIEKIKDTLQMTVKTRSYETNDAMIQALYNYEVKAVILNEAMRSLIKDKYKDFDQKTVVLDNYKNVKQVQEAEESKPPIIETREPITIFLSGVDNYGEDISSSPNDVNTLATINFETKQILLLSTPRDYYVNLSISGDEKDKLTYAGLYGIDVSLDTIEAIYDVDIDYYARVNFTGFKSIIDALGGITVHSDLDFTTDWGVSFVKGDNQVNGDEALAFARQRHHLPGGDFQRIKDHQYLIEGMLAKVTSTSILLNYASLLDSIESCFITNLSSNELRSLIKYQIDESPQWELVSISTDGELAKRPIFSKSKKHSVVLPDEIKVDAAQQMLNKILKGEVVSEDMYQQLIEEGKAQALMN